MGYITKATIDGSNYKLAGALYGTCDTAAGTAAKVVTCADFDSLETGVTIYVKFTHMNSAANATMNVNGSGAKPLCQYGTTRVGSGGYNSWVDGAIIPFTYDGTSWVRSTVLTTANDLVSQNSTLSTDSVYPLLLKGSPNGTNETSVVRFSSGGGPSYNVRENSVGCYKFNGYVLNGACEKAVDTSIASGSTSANLPTSQAVANYVDTAVATATAGGLSYHGTASALTDITNESYKKGWYWVADDSFSWTKTTGSVTETISVDPGDMIIAHQDKTSTVGDDLDAVQSNIVALTTAEIDADWAAA